MPETPEEQHAAILAMCGVPPDCRMFDVRWIDPELGALVGLHFAATPEEVIAATPGLRGVWEMLPDGGVCLRWAHH